MSKYSIDYFVNSETISVLLILLLTGILAFSYLYPSYPDINEYFLKEQSSIANIRLPAETAIYRSKISPHGKQLISGLSIAGDSDGTTSYTTRDGTVLDVWKLMLKTNVPMATAVSDGSGVFGSFIEVPLSIDELNSLVHGIGQSFKSWTGGNPSIPPTTPKTNKHVVIALGSSLESIICFFAASLYGFSAVFIHDIENTDEEGLNESIELADPEILISSGSILDKIRFDGLSRLTTIVSVNGKVFDDEAKKVLPSHVKQYILWPDLVSGSKSTITKDIKELPKISEDPLKIVYTSKELPATKSKHNKFSNANNPSTTISNNNITTSTKIACFTNKCIVSSIASQIKSIPSSQQWSTKDKILTYNSQFSGYNFILQLSSLVTGSKLIFVDPHNIIYHPLKLISDIKPTIMITEDSITRSLAFLYDDLNIVNSIRYYRAKSQLSQGNLPKSAILAELSSLRLIHSGKYEEGVGISTEDTNTVRVLSGAYFIHALNTTLSLSPIAQTGLYDYRTSNPARWIHFGPPLPCLEVKLRDFRNYKSSDRSGQLLLRGNSLPNGTEWVEDNLIVHLGNDGCIKQLVDVDYSVPQG